MSATHMARTVLTWLTFLIMLTLPALGWTQSGVQIDAPTAHQRLRAGELTLIDIRRPEEWRQTGVAEGALRIDLRHPQGVTGFARQVLDSVGGQLDAPIALICRTGNRTARMQATLLQLGFTQVYHVPEGMVGSRAGPGWIRRGLPVDACSRC